MRGRVVLVGIVAVTVTVAVAVGVAIVAGRGGHAPSAAGTAGSRAVAPDDPRLAAAVRAAPISDAKGVRSMLAAGARPLLVQHAEARRLIATALTQSGCSASASRLDAAAAPARMAELAGQLPDGVLPDAFAAERIQMTPVLAECLQGRPAPVPTELRVAVTELDVRLDQFGVPK